MYYNCKGFSRNFSLVAKPTKYGYIMVTNVTLDQRNHGYKTMVQEFIQHIKKESLFLLKDLLER